MRIQGLLCSMLLMAVPLAGAAQAIEGAPDGYKLVWEDNFNGTALNENCWTIEVSGTGGGNQELQYYRRENVSVADGNLVLTARRESFSGKSFTSGRINSNQKAAFKHGVMQARIKFPHTANGLWPAYWMMGNDINKYGWPRCGEIDIIEMGHANGISAGTQDKYFSGTTHWGPDASNENHQFYSQGFTGDKFNNMVPVANDDYHIFTIEWDGDYLYMYYDLEAYTAAKRRAARYFTQSIPYSESVSSAGHYFQKPFYFLFNLAVGGTYPGIYDAAGITALPTAGSEAKMYVDWVRVYQKEGDEDNRYLYYDDEGNKVTNIEDEPEKPHQDDNTTVLSGFASEALDAEGNTTFDFNDVAEAVLISASDGVRGHLLTAGATVYDYNVNNTNRNLYIWENTFFPVDRSGKTNSFGWDEGYNMFTVGNVGWSGLGFNIKNEDLSMIDDTYWLHFAMKADDLEQHTSHQITISNANFIVGNSDGKLASIGDFKRDGKWYYFDIPVKALRQFANPLLKAPASSFDDNIVAFISGGVIDSELCFDNIFFYKSKTKEIPTYTTTDANLGKYGYKSVVDGKWAFQLDEVGEMIPITLSNDVWNAVTGEGTYPADCLVPASMDYTQNNNYYPWEGTMKGDFQDGVANSSGVNTGGITTWASSAGVTWNGMGISSATTKDLSMIDDSYYLHIAFRSDAAVGHIPVRVRLGGENSDAVLTFGAYSTYPIFADFNRDGEWWAFDIPVAELKKYGKLWGKNNNGIVNAGENLICFYTMDTYYNGSSFSFDNIFFYKKKDGTVPEVNELGDYGYKSLDAEGKSDFAFEGKDFINFSVPMATIEMQTEAQILAGYYTLYDWEGTYKDGTHGGVGVNSFGITNQGWIDWVVGTSGWSGGGTIALDGADLTVLDQGDWYLHFAMRGTDQCNHLIGFAESRFTIGAAAFDDITPVIGNFKRDGEWYSFDIPYSVIKAQKGSALYPAASGGQAKWKGNLVWFMSGGHTGDELQLDNVFFWRNHIDTAIDEMVVPHKPVVEDNAIYDLMGRRVARESLKKGIYIINGKKVVIR